MPSNQVTKQLVVMSQDSLDSTRLPEQVALFNSDGSVLTVVQTTAAMILTGYAIAVAGAALSAADTLNVALGKLEKRILDLENA